jgi:hypothetical protein
MSRLLLFTASLVALVLIPATSAGASPSRAHVRGTVGSKSQSAHLVSVRASHRLFALRVPGSLSRIRVGARVELRGTTLRVAGRGSSLLASGVSVVSSAPLQAPTVSDDQGDDDQPGAQPADDNDQDGSGPSADDNDDDGNSGPAAMSGHEDDHGDHGGGSGSGDDDGGTDD